MRRKSRSERKKGARGRSARGARRKKKGGPDYVSRAEGKKEELAHVTVCFVDLLHLEGKEKGKAGLAARTLCVQLLHLQDNCC